MCENQDLVEEYAHLPLNTPVTVRDSGGLAPCHRIGSILCPTASRGFANSKCLSGGNCQVS